MWSEGGQKAGIPMSGQKRTRAEEIARKLHWNGVEDRVRVIAAALEDFGREERERCAKIAEEELLVAKCSPAGLDHNGIDLGHQIAARIREGK